MVLQRPLLNQVEDVEKELSTRRSHAPPGRKHRAWSGKFYA